ncbi:tyrosine-type recombinase/integrase [Nocardia cyriacigeorgica]|uniref:tyrosine-type recombinase/integrase n=1 Tax=Nocardia cyriacigeorgica TaxID=135487 RepID=UPI00189520E0|nr:site-specific integrase [Nocardia cyriacigeorgica]MBF6439574.1 site-specific integrase [Nocardia cyriacigeorgica]
MTAQIDTMAMTPAAAELAAPFPAGVQALRTKFPPRVNPADWPHTLQERVDVVARLAGERFRVANPGSQRNIRRGISKTLDWLEQFPGESWQDRWLASGSQTRLGRNWLDGPLQSRREAGVIRTNDPADLMAGLNLLICGDVIRPSMTWLLTRKSGHLANLMARSRDPEGFAQLQRLIESTAAEPIPVGGGRGALVRVARIIAAKGGTVGDITPGDCVELIDTQGIHRGLEAEGRSLFYTLLHSLAIFPTDAPATIRAFRAGQGRLSVEQLVDRYDLRCTTIRDLLISYLKERAPSLDYGSLNGLAGTLAGRFWSDLEAHHAGISSLHLAPDVAAAWKERLKTRPRQVRNDRGDVEEVQVPRLHAKQTMMVVRAFYLDIAHWALEDPGTWAQWAVPCPIKDVDVKIGKDKVRHKAKMDHRTRERLPVLPVLVETANQRRRAAADRLQAALACEPGALFTASGETLLRANAPMARSGKVWAEDPDTRVRRNLTTEDSDAFWAWACIEVLRATGVRIEELLELTHHSITEYRLPTTGELVPLLQIAPSKTDTERMLLVSPELADVLSAIIRRIRTTAGSVPVIPSYDGIERVWNPPMPLLFQRPYGGERRAITQTAVRQLLLKTLLATGLTDASQQPLIFLPHDFRRLFITDAILNGLPPHIAQVIAGHRNIASTMGYKAIYPQETIEAHRAFISRRRALRPSEEYRTPTDAEWDSFLTHFEKRKVSIGTCGRAFNSPCIHEHACVRCSLLRPDPDQRARLVEIRDNLHARIIEAKQQGWLGEVEGLQVSLTGAEDKLTQLDRSTTTGLGLPQFGDSAGRNGTAELRRQ